MTVSIFDDITSRDPMRIHAAVWAILRLRDAEVLDALAASLPEIEGATAGVELGGMIYPNRKTLEHALLKLEYHRGRKGCLCALYPELLLYDPEQEAQAGNIRILDTQYFDEKWLDSYRCECTACDTLFHVECGEAHSPWWKWKQVPRE